MNNTKYEIAIQSKEELQSKTKAVLTLYAKTFELRGYSKLKKDELIELVFNASNVLRQQIINEKASEILESQLKEEQLVIDRMEELTVENPVLPSHIHKLVLELKEKATGENVANILFTRCKDAEYALTTIAKNMTRLLKTALDELVEQQRLDFKLSVDIKSAWDELVYHINFEQRVKERQRINNMAIQAEKTIEGGDKIIDWAIKNIDNTERIYYQAIAFSILTGRRMVEIFGITEYEKDAVGIRCKKLAKKKATDETECVLISLGDDDKLVDFINNFHKRGRTPKQVNGTIAPTISKQFPQELKDLGIEKFKDCRDFYAGTINTTFTNLGVRKPENFTMYCMGHQSKETTDYYGKFDVKPITHKDEAIIKYIQSYKS